MWKPASLLLLFPSSPLSIRGASIFRTNTYRAVARTTTPSPKNLWVKTKWRWLAKETARGRRRSEGGGGGGRSPLLAMRHCCGWLGEGERSVLCCYMTSARGGGEGGRAIPARLSELWLQGVSKASRYDSQPTLVRLCRFNGPVHL